MSNYEKVLSKVLESSKVRSIGLRKEIIEELIGIYNKSVVEVMIDEGFVDIDEYCRIEIVKTQSRVHVLRGKEYSSTRTYKLRTHMHDNLYRCVKDSYSLLE